MLFLNRNKFNYQNIKIIFIKFLYFLFINNNFKFYCLKIFIRKNYFLIKINKLF